MDRAIENVPCDRCIDLPVRTERIIESDIRVYFEIAIVLVTMIMKINQRQPRAEKHTGGMFKVEIKANGRVICTLRITPVKIVTRCRKNSAELAARFSENMGIMAGAD